MRTETYSTRWWEARMVLNKPLGASYIQVGLVDPEAAPRVAEQMEYALEHSVASWQSREKSWLEVFRLLRFSSAITMGVILVIAGLGMFNTLAIIVMERQREIAILRSMGYTRRDIVGIFVSQGIIVFVLGTLLGWLLAVGLTGAIEQLPIRIRGVFSTNHIVVAWSIWHYLAGALMAGVVVFFASVIPARRAAKIEPATIIRETSG